MQRQGEDQRVAGEDTGSTVALMDVKVNHQRMQRQAFSAQHVDRHRDIVEDTKATTPPGQRVMSATSQIDGYLVVAGVACRLDGGAHRAT